MSCIRLKGVKDMGMKEFIEVDSIDACENFLVNFNRYAGGAAFAQTEAACQCDLALEGVGDDGVLHQLYDFRGAFEVAGAANAYLNDHAFSLLSTFSWKNASTSSGVTEKS